MFKKKNACPGGARQICTLSILALAALSVRGAPPEDAACRPVFAAITRLVQTPNHQFVHQTSDAPGSVAHDSEMISTGKAIYAMHDGRWESSPMTAEQTLRHDEQSRKNSKTRCRRMRSESVNGVSADMYSVHSHSEYGSSDGQIWISQADALPLRQQIDLALDGKTGKTHIDTRFVYTGVEAPAGAK